jgi:hypothetical protein
MDINVTQKFEHNMKNRPRDVIRGKSDRNK